MVISVKSGLKSRPTFAHLHMQLDKAALYLAVGRSHNIKNTPGKPGVFYVGSLANMLMVYRQEGRTPKGRLFA